MLDHSGNIIDLPYIGCYAGCSRNYCYLFGVEIPETLMFLIGVTLFFGLIALALIIYFYVKNILKDKSKEKKK